MKHLVNTTWGSQNHSYDYLVNCYSAVQTYSVFQSSQRSLTLAETKKKQKTLFNIKMTLKNSSTLFLTLRGQSCSFLLQCAQNGITRITLCSDSSYLATMELNSTVIMGSVVQCNPRQDWAANCLRSWRRKNLQNIVQKRLYNICTTGIAELAMEKPSTRI